MNRNELNNLILLGESQTLEFKKSVTKELGKEICAFANSSGGKILLGVADDGKIYPLNDLNRLYSDVQNHARNCEPPVPVHVDSIDGVIIVDVRASRNKPHSAKGIFYLREGANCQRMSRTQIKEFFFKEGLLYFDAAINHKFDIEKDITTHGYEEFTQRAGISTNLEKEDVLKNIGLMTSEGMTNAGTLVLGQKGSRFLISATLTCALFQGTTKTKVLDQKVFDGTILSNYQNAILYLQAHLNTEYIIGIEREEKLELPVAVLREALINALVHRDYRSTANVQVYIFSDRVEIVNPGGLVGGLTLKDLGKRSAPRNPLLFGILYRMELVEHIGSGLKRIREELQQNNLPKPVLDVDDNWFSIVISRKVIAPVETPVETPVKTSEMILQILLRDSSLTLKDVSDRIGKSLSAVERASSKLVKDRKLKFVGPKKSGHWEVLD